MIQKEISKSLAAKIHLKLSENDKLNNIRITKMSRFLGWTSKMWTDQSQFKKFLTSRSLPMVDPIIMIVRRLICLEESNRTVAERWAQIEIRIGRKIINWIPLAERRALRIIKCLTKVKRRGELRGHLKLRKAGKYPGWVAEWTLKQTKEALLKVMVVGDNQPVEDPHRTKEEEAKYKSNGVNKITDLGLNSLKNSKILKTWITYSNSFRSLW